MEVSFRILRPYVVAMDGGEMLYSSVCWPKEGLVEDLVNSVEYYLSKFISVAVVFLIFDLYFENSIESVSRLGQIGAY